jgi:hypothetical protein
MRSGAAGAGPATDYCCAFTRSNIVTMCGVCLLAIARRACWLFHQPIHNYIGCCHFGFVIFAVLTAAIHECFRGTPHWPRALRTLAYAPASRSQRRVVLQVTSNRRHRRPIECAHRRGLSALSNGPPRSKNADSDGQSSDDNALRPDRICTTRAWLTIAGGTWRGRRLRPGPDLRSPPCRARFLHYSDVPLRLFGHTTAGRRIASSSSRCACTPDGCAADPQGRRHWRIRRRAIGLAARDASSAALQRAGAADASDLGIRCPTRGSARFATVAKDLRGIYLWFR